MQTDKQIARGMTPEIFHKEQMNIVIAGHVDHGKSTIIGRMLVDTNSLPDGKLDQVKETCKRNAKPFEYAFLLDALKEEQSQGITIDSARVFFKTNRRDYIIIDAPGHIEFLKNMVTGASRADAALLVIDAEEGVQENSRRHGYMISMLGIRQMMVLINKMDLIGYREDVFQAIIEEFTSFLEQIHLRAEFIPVSGTMGDNIASVSKQMPWYTGKTVLQAVDSFTKEARLLDKPFRMPVQDVYKFTEHGDKRRIIAGTVESGQLSVGDEIVFYPSGKSGIVKTMESYNGPPKNTIIAGHASAFTLDKQIYISRGELAVRAGQVPPKVSGRFRVNLFWMGRKPMVSGTTYLIKVGTTREEVELEEVISVIDASDLASTQKKDQVEHHDVADCILRTRRAIAFDPIEDIAPTGRFVIVDDFEIRGGGIIREVVPDEQVWIRDFVMQRNYRWETSAVSRDDRIERYNQKPTLLLVTGRRNVGKKSLARALEARLFGEGKIVYFMGIGNILYGVDADIKKPGSDENRPEHLRRLAEVANIMLDAGVILVVTAIALTQKDLEMIRATVDTDSIYVVWLGPDPTDITHDVIVSQLHDVQEGVQGIKRLLQDKGVIFRP
ncbi:MAG: adenylyl-sulfate kinase [Sedimentisphaerales bacterium]|nr:adenylyl-sulfate kinase [Sedimentisphaerales bacterium]